MPRYQSGQAVRVHLWRPFSYPKQWQLLARWCAMRKQFPAPQWADDVNHWLDSLKAAAYSPATLSTRRCQLTALSHALGGSPLDVDADELVDYFASRSWKPETRKSARNAVVSFFRWLQAESVMMIRATSCRASGGRRPIRGHARTASLSRRCSGRTMRSD